MIGGPLAIVFGPLGPVVGAFVGAFLAAIAYELYTGKKGSEALRAGWGTFLGRTGRNGSEACNLGCDDYRGGRFYCCWRSACENPYRPGPHESVVVMRE